MKIEDVARAESLISNLRGLKEAKGRDYLLTRDGYEIKVIGRNYNIIDDGMLENVKAAVEFEIDRRIKAIENQLREMGVDL